MTLENGVYFGLSDETYFAHPALSSTGIKQLQVSTLDFWSRSWMNPAKVEDTEEEDTMARKVGKAYHKRIVEGKAAFDALYASELDPADYPDALRTADDIKARLKDLGQPVTAKNKAELVERLLAVEPNAQVWDELLADHVGDTAGRILLPPDLIPRIELSAAMVEKHPQLSKAFTGGVPEVSVLWTCPETGVPMKARMDYWKQRAIVDLKTFANKRQKPIDKAIAQTMAEYKYHIQCVVYDEAADQAAQFIRDGRTFGEADPDLLKRLATSSRNDRQFMFVFQQKGIAPVARGKVLPRMLVYDCGKVVVDQAKETFAKCVEVFGTGPWVDVADVSAFDDSEFPIYMTE